MAMMITQARSEDLPAINRVIETAVMGWSLPERVKRLSLASYRYTPTDLAYLSIHIASNSDRVLGVAAWETADPADLAEGQSGLLLHGIYVDAAQQRQGVGRQLWRVAVNAAQQQGLDGLLVKAIRDAEGFFRAMGMQSLPVNDENRDYAHRYWLPL